jgi:ubiquinone/menaquinone biosynthesis C-methylase UbiE
VRAHLRDACEATPTEVEMAEQIPQFDSATVAAQWDIAAPAYAAAQANGLDFYRYDFFGPALVALCGNVTDTTLLDVGCGSGYFSREMARAGARVTGADISAQMIEHAKAIEAQQPLGIEYVACDALDLESHFAAESIDVATSCLALHDMPEAAEVLRVVHRLLTPGGRFVFTMMHPFAETPFREWERNPDRSKRWLCVDRYFDEQAAALEWTRWGGFVTMSYHATLETWIAWVLDAGFEIRQLKEPRPTTDAIARQPGLEDASRMPYYLSLDLRKRA